MSDGNTSDGLEALRASYADDVRAGRVRALAEYLEEFPAAAGAFAAEYVAREQARLTGRADGFAATGQEAGASPVAFDADRSAGRVSGPATSNEQECAGAGPGGAAAPAPGPPFSSSKPDPDRLGPYEIRKLLGSGAFGAVYRARDPRLGRDVALKVLKTSVRLAPEAEARFKREAALAARLDHPGICAIHDVGVEDGTPYIAMRLVEGETLAEKLRRAASGPEESSFVGLESGGGTTPEVSPPAAHRRSGGPCTAEEVSGFLRLVESAARALHVAHEAGIVHRDIKPGNIMVTPEGQPVILDFGLARFEDAGESLSVAGDLAGTPAYMSPEQLLANRVRLDRRTDVWSLGVTLFECLSLRRPFEAPTREQLYQTIITREPPPARKLNPAIPADLAVVLSKALEKDRERRYHTALDFAEDLRRVRNHEPILARPVGPLGRLARWAQRNPAVAGLAAAVFVVLSAGLAATFVQKVRADRNLSEYERLADLRRLDDVIREEREDLWPAVPERVPAMESWLRRARELTERLPEHEAVLAAMRAKAQPWTEEQKAKDRASHAAGIEELAELEAARDEVVHDLKDLEASSLPEARKEKLREELDEKLAEAEARFRAGRERVEPLLAERVTYAFDDPSLPWRHEKLASLVARLRAFASAGPKESGVRSVEERLESARTVRKRTVDDHAAAWEACLKRVAGNPKYAPGTLTCPQVGLIPLGPDPVSTLEEFHDVQTGARPERGPEGRFLIGEQTGIVFVLLPGGTFTMGSQRNDPAKPHHDPLAQAHEGPPHDVVLAPWFLSKYEMTQGQWLRVEGTNPSIWSGQGSCPGGCSFDMRHPVEQVSWTESRGVLARLGYALPTEAQWESACRVGTGTPWETGKEPLSLSGSENIGGEEFRAHYGNITSHEAGFTDAWPHHAPVGSLRPNGFGLHDMHGNVLEWCEDGYGSYRTRPQSGTGLRIIPGARFRVGRGGSFYVAAVDARSAFRVRYDRSARVSDLGLRAARPITDF